MWGCPCAVGTFGGIRLWIDGLLVIDHWQTGATRKDGTINLTAGLHDIKVEFFKETGNASAKIYWISNSTPYGIIPQDHLYPPDTTGEAGYAPDGIHPKTGNTTLICRLRKVNRCRRATSR